MESMTTQQVADALGTSIDTVIRMIKGGQLKASRLRPGSPYRIRVDSLAEYANQNSIDLKLTPTQPNQ